MDLVAFCLMCRLDRVQMKNIYLDTWPKRKDGFHSTSGTTATVVILRDGKLYVAHVGDSAAVLCCKNDKDFDAQELTRDHKPEDVNEKAR